MWVDKHNAFLALKCANCGEELDGVVDDSPGLVEPVITVELCSCETDRWIERVEELEADIEDMENKLKSVTEEAVE